MVKETCNCSPLIQSFEWASTPAAKATPDLVPLMRSKFANAAQIRLDLLAAEWASRHF